VNWKISRMRSSSTRPAAILALGAKAAIYHNVRAAATSHESNFWMEPIRRLRKKRGMIFCGVENAANE
jgi:hypothetical protein